MCVECFVWVDLAKGIQREFDTLLIGGGLRNVGSRKRFDEDSQSMWFWDCKNKKKIPPIRISHHDPQVANRQMVVSHCTRANPRVFLSVHHHTHEVLLWTVIGNSNPSTQPWHCGLCKCGKSKESKSFCSGGVGSAGQWKNFHVTQCFCRSLGSGSLSPAEAHDNRKNM